MKPAAGFLALWFALAHCQGAVECTRELVSTSDCADVINPTACYNQFRFRNAQTLQCIHGENDADRARKACNCCSCVGDVMCNWVTQNNICAM